MTCQVRVVLSVLFLGSVFLPAGCAAPRPVTSESHGKQFTTMWEEIYGRLKPEIDSGNIFVERGEADSFRPASGTIAAAGESGSGSDGSRLASANGTPGTGSDSAAPSLFSAAGSGSGSKDPPREYIRIRLTDRVLFDSGEDRIKADGIDVLTRLGRILVGEQGLNIVIEGHTDNVSIRERLRPRFPDNMALAQARAINAAQILRNSGVTGDGLRLAWFGESRPIGSNESEEGRGRNRRVEIMITPK